MVKPKKLKQKSVKYKTVLLSVTENITNKTKYLIDLNIIKNVFKKWV